MPSDAAPEEMRSESGMFRFVRTLLKKKLATISLAVILLFYGAGLYTFIPGGLPYSYREQNIHRTNEGPSVDHFFGTDRLGRDVFTRTLYSLRTTVLITIAVTATGGIVISVGLGLLAGYRGGLVDSTIDFFGKIFSMFPPLIILLYLTFAIRPRYDEAFRAFSEKVHMEFLVTQGFSDFFLISGIFSLFFWYGSVRLIRSQVLALREQEFVLAARAMGASTPRILFRHLLPNVSGLIILGFVTSLGTIAGSEIGLTYLGLGVQPPHPSFGAMIYDAGNIRTIQAYPHLLLVPGSVVAILLFAFVLLRDALVSIVNPKAGAR